MNIHMIWVTDLEINAILYRFVGIYHAIESVETKIVVVKSKKAA